ncbi:unnamed protein product [Didymodactylos carnosus]|uniref:Cytochrome P450 n=1 Tax=Didymodactylos carnosus TaxID=1234261 RepID=A0A8S2SS44_9BILA|nr:unnamed protein product [Didymodactylos carnosus]CAF4245981.1 unnamed protein product [Didymodactylos carnosus]
MQDILKCTDEHLAVWRETYGGQDKTNEIDREIFKEYSNLMMDIIGIIAFDHNFNAVGKIDIQNEVPNHQEMTLGEATSFLMQTLADTVLLPLPTFLKRFYLTCFCPKYRRSLSILHDYVYRIIEEHKGKYQKAGNEDESKPAVRQNLLTLLTSSLQEDELMEAKKAPNEREGISRQELLDNITMLIFAGYETTATVLSWFTYFVSKRAEVQKKMKQEIREYCSAEYEVTVENLRKLEYVDCVLKETLRLAPTVVAVSREPTLSGEKTELDRVILSKGQNLMVAIACLHTDERNWKMNPLEFLPERFYGPNAPDADHHPFAFLPFGGGRHQCAGQDLARFELKLIIVRLMQHVIFEDAPGNTGGHVQRVTVIPKNMAIRVRFDDKKVE